MDVLWLRATTIAGEVVGGVALAVSAPLDIYQIASNGYHLAKSGRNSEDESDLTCGMWTEIEKWKGIVLHWTYGIRRR